MTHTYDSMMTDVSQNHTAMPSSSQVPMVPDTDSKFEAHSSGHDLRRLDSGVTLESEESDVSEDLPPPYKV